MRCVTIGGARAAVGVNECAVRRLSQSKHPNYYSPRRTPRRHTLALVTAGRPRLDSPSTPTCAAARAHSAHTWGWRPSKKRGQRLRPRTRSPQRPPTARLHVERGAPHRHSSCSSPSPSPSSRRYRRPQTRRRRRRGPALTRRCPQ